MTNMMSELNASAARDQVRSMMVRQFWRERTTAYSMDDNNDVQELLTRMAKCSQTDSLSCMWESKPEPELQLGPHFL